MKERRTIVLDCEAVQALIDPKHSKHWLAISAVLTLTRRNKKRGEWVRLVVPTSVRVESGWDRRKPNAATINQLRFLDAVLSTRAADRAAAVRSALEVSVADAHLAAVLEDTEGPHTVLASDRKDLGRIAGHLGLKVAIVPV